MGGALFVTHQDVFYRVLLVKLIINVQHGPTRVAEQIFHAFVFEAAHKDLGPSQSLTHV